MYDDVHFAAALSSMYVQLQSNLFSMAGLTCEIPVNVVYPFPFIL